MGGGLFPTGSGGPHGSTQAPQERSVAAWLEDLGHGEAARRQRAHDRLVRRLGPDDWPALVEVAGGADFASRRGLALVLADHPRHFVLAARLTAQPDPILSQVGAWALEESSLAWNANLIEAPLPLSDFPDKWLLEGGRQDRLLANPSAPSPGGLAVALDRLHLFGDAPANLILDPRLDARRRMASPPSQASVLEGSWELLLVQLAKEHKVTMEVIAWRPEPVDAPGADQEVWPGAFVRICARGDTGSGRGSELLARWVRGAAQDLDSHRRVACANALAQVGWPPAIDWLGQRWMGGDDDFYEAVCIAAARGHLPSVLLSPEGVQRLLVQGVTRAVDRTGREWDRELLAARALRAVPSVLRDGSTLGDALLKDWPADQVRGEWLRFEAFAGRFRVHEGLAARALKRLRSEGEPPLRRVALAALVSAGGMDVGPVENLSSMGIGLRPEAMEAWIRDMELAGVKPAGAEGFEALESRPGWMGRFGFWWHVVGETSQADRAAQAVLTNEDGLQDLANALSRPLARGRRQEVLTWVRRLQETMPDQGNRLALRLNLMGGPRAFEYLESILAMEAPDGDALMDLAHLAAMDTVGARARGALIGALEKDPMPNGLGRALEQAQFNLRSSGEFLLTEMFEADVRRKVVRGSHPLTDRILGDGWAQSSPVGPRAALRAPLGAIEETPLR